MRDWSFAKFTDNEGDGGELLALLAAEPLAVGDEVPVVRLGRLYVGTVSGVTPAGAPVIRYTCAGRMHEGLGKPDRASSRAPGSPVLVGFRVRGERRRKRTSTRARQAMTARIAATLEQSEAALAADRRGADGTADPEPPCKLCGGRGHSPRIGGTTLHTSHATCPWCAEERRLRKETDQCSV